MDESSNEITAIPALLELLDITGAIITIDAMGTQTNIVKLIHESREKMVFKTQKIKVQRSTV